jgi:uncharacterized protein (TIGR02300 family)
MRPRGPSSRDLAAFSAIDRARAARQVKLRFSGFSEEPMAKADLGTKRVCPDTGRKFYDLNKTPVISPYTGKVVPIAVAPTRSRPEPAAPARPAPVVEAEAVVPETADVELVSLDDAEAEQQGKKPAAAAAGAEGAAAAGEEEEVEIGDESLDDAAFIEEEEEGDADVSDIIGEGVEKEEET